MVWWFHVSKFRDHWSLALFCWHIPIPWFEVKSEPKGDFGLDNFGITIDWGMGYVRFEWGNRTKAFDFPWAWDHCLHEVMLKDGSFAKAPKCGSEGYDAHPYRPLNGWSREYGSGIWLEIHNFVATDVDGGKYPVQVYLAVDRRTWRWKWFKFLPWPRKVKTCIDYAFTDEVGTRKGSWKGGQIGGGYGLRKNETPVECLRRMEREYRFS